MIRIDGKRLTPAPLITINKNWLNTGDGRPLSSQFQITLNGTILPARGSPMSTGAFYMGTGTISDESISNTNSRFNSILRKQEAIRELFDRPGLLLEYFPDDWTSTPVSGYVKLNSIAFSEGTWIDRCPYNIVLETEVLNKGGTGAEDSFGIFDNYFLASAQEQININDAEDGTDAKTINHTVSAVGRSSYSGLTQLRSNKEPWENAKDWCVTRLNQPFNGYIVNTTGLIKYNTKRSEQIDRWAGSYTLTVNYISNTGNVDYVHNYDVNTLTNRSQIDDLNNGQLVTENITINGTVIGLSSGAFSQSGRINAARYAFNTFIAPNVPTYAGLGTGHLFVTKSYGENTANGTLVYSFNYTNYPVGNGYTHTYAVNDTRSAGGNSQAAINGTIKYNTVSGSVTNTFAASTGIWLSIKSTLRSQIVNIIGYNVVAEPVNVTINYNKSAAQVDYTATYNYINGDNGASANYLDQYEVSVNDSNQIFGSTTFSPNATVTIAGSILGYSFDGSSDERYANALARWNSIKSNLRGRATGTLGTTGIANKILSKTENYNKINGIITYTYNFPVKALPDSGIINEEITVDINYAKDVYAIHLIPGLSSGPILQNLGTITEASKTLNVVFNLEPGTPTTTADTRFNNLATTYAPATGFIANNTSNQNLYNGVYTRSKTWIYRQ